MDKKVIKYNEYKTQELALTTIDDYIQTIREGDFSSELLKKLCGAVSYNSLFMIDSYNLVNGKQYSIENVCYHMRGLLKVATHELLDNISDITLPNACFDEILCKVLDESLFGEIVTEMKLNAKDLYCAFLLFYLHLRELYNCEPYVLSMWGNKSVSIDKVWNYFRTEIQGVVL